MFADVAFPISHYQVFTYAVKTQHQALIRIGQRVRAPIGRRLMDGVIVNISETTEFDGKIKAIREILDDKPILDKSLWKLIEWISRYYFTPLGKAASVIPKNLSVDYTPQEQWYVRVISDKPTKELEQRAPAQYKAYQVLAQFESAVAITKLNKIVASPITICKGLQAKGFVELLKKKKNYADDNFSFSPLEKKIDFSAEQQKALDSIDSYFSSNEHAAMLLHGVTGSGKTEIYIKAAEKVLNNSQSVLILLPEIALTPQIAGRIRSVFGEKVGLWHSKLTGAVRAATWSKICNEEYQVIVGARSAIFAPLKNLGLIIVDEEQDTSYKQEEPEPHYNARDVALMRGKINSAKVLLVSATPSLESYYNHIMGKYAYCYLSKRFKEAVYPQVTVVDMIKEQEESGKTGQVFSGLLQDKVSERLKQNEQIILLQNRRGYAPIYRCRDCGEIFDCPTCSIPLTYHRDGDNLQCHFCGYNLKPIPHQCRNCSSEKLYLSGTGTQKVEGLVRETFPGSRIERLDTDSIKSGKELTRTLQEFNKGTIDILLGTQMIAKGLDFGNVTLVGIINADTGLFLPDFRSGEKVFQLIYQAAGRSGRGAIKGEVIVQSFNADNPVIRYAARLDLKKYYNIIIGERKELGYPPFTRLAKAVFVGNDRNRVEKVARQTMNSFSAPKKNIEILGPAWCYREKLRNKYRMQIVFKSSKETDPNGTILHNYISKNLLNQKLPGSIKLNIDIDPVSLL